MKKTILVMFVLSFALYFWGCSISEDYFNEIEETKEFQTFEEVSQPYSDLYGTPEKIENWYETLDFYYVEWWWNIQGFMIRFVQTTSDNFRWSIDHISEWITLEETAQPYLDLYGEPIFKVLDGINVYSSAWVWDFFSEMLTIMFNRKNLISDWQ